MVDIASCSRYATTSLVYDLHHIARSVLYQIGEGHRIAGYDQEASTSHGSSIRPPLSSTSVCMQPIRGRGRGRGRRRVDHRGRGQDGEGGRGTPEPTLPTSIPPPPPPPPPHTYPSPEIFIPSHIDTSPSIPPHTYTSPSIPPHTYTSHSIPPDTYTSLPYPLSPELKPTSITVDITFSSHPLSSPTLPPIGNTILDLVSELGSLPTRRPRAPRIRRVIHPSAPSVPSTPSAPSAPSAISAPSALSAPFEIARDPIAQQAVYSKRRPKRNIKTSSCGTH